MIDQYTRHKERRPLLYYFNILFWSLLFLVKPTTGVTQNSIKNDKDIIVTYNAANALVDATIYKTGNRCFYYYAKVKHTSGLKTIQEPAPGEWKASYLFDASDDCKNQVAREEILKRDREGCDDLPTAIKTIKGAVGIEEPQKVVTIVNSVCLDALKELSYEEIIKLIKVIAKQPKLKEDSELAIIRLINAINSNKYGDFFRVLEENQNELIKYLVEQIDDASLCFWYDNNYTNFMGALVKMCQSQTTSYLNKIPEAGDEKLLGQILNVYNQPFKNDLPSTGIITGVVSMNEFTFCGIYDKDRGTIDIERKQLVINPAVTGSDVDNRPQPEVKGTIVATGLSPLTPIIYTAENELPLVATALDMPADTKAHQYIVPAIFLKYKGTKEFNDAAERSGMIVLDAVTIAASGSAALATKVNWVKRIWALSEVVGAIGNIGVNTQTVTDPNLIEAINIYNGAMGVIGIKNLAQTTGKGLINFVRELPPTTIKLLKENQTLRSSFISSILDYRIAITRLKNSDTWTNLPAEVRQKIIRQEESFITFAKAVDYFDDWGVPKSAFQDGWTKLRVLNEGKGNRPLPETYLTPSHIQQHLAKFEEEVSCLTFKNSIKQYGQIGRDDGLFVMPKYEMDNLLKRTGTDIAKIETELGIPKGRWASMLDHDPLNPDQLVRVDIKVNSNSHLRIPSGNEYGADETLWIPGGKTFGGISEAIIDPVKAESNIYNFKIIIE